MSRAGAGGGRSRAWKSPQVMTPPTTHIPIKSRIRSQIQTSQNRHNHRTDQVGAEGHVELPVDVAQESGTGESPVSRETPAQSALPRVAGNLASHPGRYDQAFQGDRTRFAPQRLVEEGQDRHPRGGFEQFLQVVHAEEHGDGVKPGGHEPDGHRPHDGDGDHPLGARHFLRHVGGAVDAGERPIRVDQSDDKRFPGSAIGPRRGAGAGALTDAVLPPSGVVHEIGKHKPGRFMGRRGGGDRDQNDGERDERGIQGGGGDIRQELAVTVEEKGDGVHQLIAYEHVPRLIGTTPVSMRDRGTRSTTHNVGWESCQQPTPALPTATATLAEVKMLPAQANHPVK